MIVRAHLPLALATVLVLSGCGAASAATPSHSAPHHATHRTKRPAVRPASHPLADLRLAVLQANVATLPAGIGPFPGEVPLVLRVQVQNPTAQSVFFPAILFDLTAAHPPTTCAPESNVPACSNSVGADGEFLPPAPSLFPIPAGVTNGNLSTSIIDTVGGHFGLTIGAHATLSGNITMLAPAGISALALQLEGPQGGLVSHTPTDFTVP